MGKRDKEVTAKTFEAPLLSALLQLSEQQADKNVPRGLVISETLIRMNLHEEAYGFRNGKLVTHTQIGLAFRAMRTRTIPLTRSLKKGHWALTPEGVKEARHQAGIADPNSVPFEADSLQEKPRLDSAIEQTPCFGLLHDPRAQVCGSCPLEDLCEVRTFQAYSQLAAKMERNAQDTALDEALTVKIPSSPSRFASQARVALGLTADNIKLAQRVRRFKNVHVTCPLCAQVIVDEVMMVAVGRGTFHEACLTEFKQHLDKGAP